jgi:signal peptidase
MRRAVAFVATVIAVGGVGIAPAMAATPIEQIVRGRYLTLTSIGDPEAMGNLRPLVPVSWQVGVQAHPPTRSRIGIGISVVQPAGPHGLRVDIRACSVRWVDDVCSGNEGTWMWREDLATAVLSVDDKGVHQLGWMDSSQTLWVLVQTTLPSGTPAGFTTAIQLHAWGSDDAVQTIGSTAASLATTGAPVETAFGLAAISLLGGLGLAAVARLRRRRIEGRSRS